MTPDCRSNSDRWKPATVLAVCPECAAAEPIWEIGHRCLWCADENRSWYVPATIAEVAELALELAGTFDEQEQSDV